MFSNIITGEIIWELFGDLCKKLIKILLGAQFTFMDKSIEYSSGILTKSPKGWNSGLFSLMKQVSEEAIVPIAAIIFIYVMCHEFISKMLDKSIREMDIEIVAKLIFKICFGVLLLSNSYNIIMLVFQLGQNAAEKCNEIIFGVRNSDFDAILTSEAFSEQIDALSYADAIVVFLEVFILDIINMIAALIILVFANARMIEIYIYCALSPIPFSTFTSKIWESVGMNFIKNLFALAFQAFSMIFCLAMYNELIENLMCKIDISTSVAVGPVNVVDVATLPSNLLSIVGLSILLVFTLFKCGSITKSIFNAM